MRGQEYSVFIFENEREKETGGVGDGDLKSPGGHPFLWWLCVPGVALTSHTSCVGQGDEAPKRSSTFGVAVCLESFTHLQCTPGRLQKAISL